MGPAYKMGQWIFLKCMENLRKETSPFYLPPAWGGAWRSSIPVLPALSLLRYVTMLRCQKKRQNKILFKRLIKNKMK